MLQLLRYIGPLVLVCLFANIGFAHGPAHEKIEELTNKISKHPDDAHLYVERAGYYKIDGDFDKSFADYQTARNIDNTLETLDFLLAELFFDFDHMQSALACVTAFQKQEINKAECYLLKAKIFDKLFMGDSALFYAEASYPLQLKPSTHFFITVKEYTLFADKTDYTRARYWLEEGKRRMPYDLVIQEEYVNLALKFNDYATAERLCLEKIPQLKRKEYWYFLLGNVHALQGEMEMASANYTVAINSIDKLPRHHKNTTYIKNLKSQIEKEQQQLK